MLAEKRHGAGGGGRRRIRLQQVLPREAQPQKPFSKINSDLNRTSKPHHHHPGCLGWTHSPRKGRPPTQRAQDPGTLMHGRKSS